MWIAALWQTAVSLKQNLGRSTSNGSSGSIVQYRFLAARRPDSSASFIAYSWFPFPKDIPVPGHHENENGAMISHAVATVAGLDPPTPLSAVPAVEKDLAGGLVTASPYAHALPSLAVDADGH